jgi:hypothetical protein
VVIPALAVPLRCTLRVRALTWPSVANHHMYDSILPGRSCSVYCDNSIDRARLSFALTLVATQVVTPASAMLLLCTLRVRAPMWPSAGKKSHVVEVLLRITDTSD